MILCPDCKRMQIITIAGNDYEPHMCKGMEAIKLEVPGLPGKSPSKELLKAAEILEKKANESKAKSDNFKNSPGKEGYQHAYLIQAETYMTIAKALREEE